jgi:osomolarity two-component system, response regulator SKN7
MVRQLLPGLHDFLLTNLGMNDVLPKPFTKEGLLAMLEKHLAHLKKPHPGMPVDQMGSGVQPMAAGAARVKDEDSPAKSPTTGSNWNSPNQMPGVSPVGSNMTDEYMNAVQGHHGAYGVNPMGGMAYNTSSQVPMANRSNQHRRQISDISGGEDMANSAKRQQMYPGQNMNPMQRPR